MEILFYLPFLVFFSLGIYSLFKPSKESSKRPSINIRFTSETDKNIEDLHRMQKYNFWRDFDK